MVDVVLLCGGGNVVVYFVFFVGVCGIGFDGDVVDDGFVVGRDCCGYCSCCDKFVGVVDGVV